MAEGEFALAGQHLKQALHKESRDWAGLHDLFALLADIAVQVRDEMSLREYVPLLEKEAAHLDHKLYMAVAHRAWGVLHMLAGEFAEAEVRLNQALTIFGAMDTRWQLGRTHLELGELAGTRSDLAGASDHYASALELFEAMGAAPHAARAREALALIDG